MSYIVKDTTTKPANVQWFSSAYPEVISSINSWIATNTGFVSSYKESISSTSLVKIYVFDTEANYRAYLTAANSNAQEIQRKTYNASNGITSSQTVL
jgi:hypothetical protein